MNSIAKSFLLLNINLAIAVKVLKDITQAKNTKVTGQKTQCFKPKHDKSQTAMGNRNEEVEFQI